MSESTLPAANGTLFPESSERRRIEDRLTLALTEALERVRRGPVTPTLDVEQFKRELATLDLDTPRGLEDVLAWTIERFEHGIVQMGNPRYFGLFNPGASFPSQCADRIISLFNPQLASSASSPIPVALETHLIRTVGARAGLNGNVAGHFATGGAESNYTALLCALTTAEPGFADRGARAFSGAPRLYASRESHITWLKVAHQSGIGRSALRLVETDGRGRLEPGALAQAISEDRARGDVPVMIAATAGTTSGGMIDPLAACARIAERERLWYHVDAAWGGAALASERLRPLLAGIECADSITLDAHKWFATTMGCALFMTRRGEILPQTFHASALFMPSNVVGVDPYQNSVQWSRRALGLRLFLTLATVGWRGLGAHVERSIAVVERIRERLTALGWQLANDSPLAVLNVLPPGGEDVRALVRNVVASGRAWVAPASFEQRDVVRICATHGQSSEPDIDALIAALEAARAGTAGA